MLKSRQFWCHTSLGLICGLYLCTATIHELFFNCSLDHPSCLAHLNSFGWAIWAAIKKHSLNPYILNIPTLGSQWEMLWWAPVSGTSPHLTLTCQHLSKLTFISLALVSAITAEITKWWCGFLCGFLVCYVIESSFCVLYLTMHFAVSYQHVSYHTSYYALQYIHYISIFPYILHIQLLYMHLEKVAVGNLPCNLPCLTLLHCPYLTTSYHFSRLSFPNLPYYCSYHNLQSG